MTRRLGGPIVLALALHFVMLDYWRGQGGEPQQSAAKTLTAIIRHPAPEASALAASSRHPAGGTPPLAQTTPSAQLRRTISPPAQAALKPSPAKAHAKQEYPTVGDEASEVESSARGASSLAGSHPSPSPTAASAASGEDAVAGFRSLSVSEALVSYRIELARALPALHLVLPADGARLSVRIGPAAELEWAALGGTPLLQPQVERLRAVPLPAVLKGKARTVELDIAHSH